jgi:hypothetical protein
MACGISLSLLIIIIFVPGINIIVNTPKFSDFKHAGELIPLAICLPIIPLLANEAKKYVLRAKDKHLNNKTI